MLRLIALLVALPAAALAQSAREAITGAALLPGWREGAVHMSALKLTLAPGWKTYWRAPGDAGIAPRFDYAGSRNLRAVAPLWPRPEVFELGGMTSYGYHEGLVLPLAVTPQGPGPVLLKAVVEIGVCKEICVPATLTLEAELPEGGSRNAEIGAAMADLPEPRNVAATCASAPIKDGLRVTVSADLPPVAGEHAVIDLADPTMWVSEPVMARQGNRISVTADMVPAEAKPFALDRSRVILTVIGQGQALEVRGCRGG